MQPTPQYWSSHEEEVTVGGRRYDLTMWGWSWRSVADAAQVAAERVAAFVRSGPSPSRASQYYPRVPLREESLEQIHHGDDLVAEVTRNRYGAAVLNTDAVLIADIDLPEEPRPRRRGLFKRRQPDGPSPAEEQARQTISAFTDAHPNWGVHVYRTFGGFRVIVTGTGALPGSPQGTAILIELGSDPLYVTLCTTHNSYRARLTPKPWRLAVPLPALAIQWPAAEQEGRYQRWVGDYQQASAGSAACRRESWNQVPGTVAEGRVIEAHNAWSGSDSGAPLA